MLILLLASLLALGPAPGFDTDGDGTSDCSVLLADRDGDGSFDRPQGLPHGTGSSSDSIRLVKVWDSGTVLNNQWDACCGFLDDDSLLDILGHHWNPNQLHVFESNGAGGFDHVWTQHESLPPGSYSAVTYGDPDEDGEVELVAGEVSTLGKVIILENVGDDTWARPHVMDRTRERARVIRVADTNGNDTAEIVVIAGSSDGGKVSIYEHTGAPGVHSYTRIYEYTTVSYIYNGSVGDADNDGYPEVHIGIGGWHGFPMYMRRIVYDPGSGTYSHHMYEHPTVIGLHLSPFVCDIDNSGDNELVVGSSGDPYGQVRVFEHARGDTFDLLWTSSMSHDGNVIAVNSAPLQGAPFPVVFAAPFSGVLYGFTWQGSTMAPVCFTDPGTGAAIRSIDWGREPGQPDPDRLVLAESGPSDYVSVWIPEPAQSVGEEHGQPSAPPELRVVPNPVRTRLSLSVPGVVAASVWDAVGRRVATPSVTAGGISWDLTAPSGGRVGPGVYLLTARTRSGLIRTPFTIAD